MLEQMPGSVISLASANAASVIPETKEASYKEEGEMRLRRYLRMVQETKAQSNKRDKEGRAEKLC